MPETAPRPDPAADPQPSAPGPGMSRLLPVIVGAALLAAAFAVRPDVSTGILGGLCLMLGWVWLASAVDAVPGRRHPHLRKVARRPRVVAWRSRDRWLPASRAPALWWLVLAGLAAIGAGLGLLAGGVTAMIWWILFTPLLVMALALVVDVFVLMFAGYWIIAVPLALLCLAAPFVIDGAARPFLLGLGALLAGLWFADLGRALYGRRGPATGSGDASP